MINLPLLRAVVIISSRDTEFLWVVIPKTIKPKVSATGVALRIQRLSGCSDLNSIKLTLYCTWSFGAAESSLQTSLRTLEIQQKILVHPLTSKSL